MRTNKPLCMLLVGLLCAAAFAAEDAQRPDLTASADQTVAPQTPGETSPGKMQMTNTGETSPNIFTGHVLTVERPADPKRDAEAREIRRAAAAVSVTVPKGTWVTNGGQEQVVEFTGHVLSGGRGARAGGVLYLPAQADEPDFRAAVAACTGMPCDYFDARVDTPSLALLCTYDCVFTWPDLSYADAVALGDVLADYVDAGCGKVILGQWCLPTQTNWLEGRIMEADYCPVTATDDTRESRSYAGDGADCVHVGAPFVSSYETGFRDDCSLRSGAQSDGTYVDDYLSVAWRPDRRVYYSAGNTGTTYGMGEWSDLVCNMCLCARDGAVLYAPANPDNPEFRLGLSQELNKACDYYDARFGTPSLALLSNYDCILTWANYGYYDNVAMGDVLADYVDAGYGKVILGQWCLPTAGNFLAGRIMDEYSPATATSYTFGGTYSGDGVDCVHNSVYAPVSAYDADFRDDCTLVGDAVSDGTFTDGYLAVAWLPERPVYYSPGNTGASYSTGDWVELTANMCRCFFGCGDPLSGDCCEAHGTPGCSDSECCQSVCAYDPFCCEVAWDGWCADQAMEDLNCLDCVCADETTAPVAEITEPPELGAGCTCDVVAVVGSAYDPDGTFEGYALEYRKIGVPTWTLIAIGTTEVVNGWLADWDTTALTEGYYVLRLTVTNICGLAATAVRPVYVDQNYSTADIDYPPDGHIVAGNVCIDGTVYESWCGSTYTVEYKPVSGGAWQPVDPDNPVYPGTAINEPYAQWKTISLGVPDGDYFLRVEAWNNCDHSKTLTIQVTVDNTAPVAEITSPENCDQVDGMVPIVGTAYDENLNAWKLWYTGGDANGWVFIDGGSTNEIDSLLTIWNTNGLTPCPYTLKLWVGDEAELHCNSGDYHNTYYYTSVVVGWFCPIVGDINGDGVVDFFDIDPFVELITGGG